jgi:hypothetical protein
MRSLQKAKAEDARWGPSGFGKCRTPAAQKPAVSLAWYVACLKDGDLVRRDSADTRRGGAGTCNCLATSAELARAFAAHIAKTVHDADVVVQRVKYE